MAGTTGRSLNNSNSCGSFFSPVGVGLLLFLGACSGSGVQPDGNTGGISADTDYALGDVSNWPDADNQPDNGTTPNDVTYDVLSDADEALTGDTLSDAGNVVGDTVLEDGSVEDVEEEDAGPPVPAPGTTGAPCETPDDCYSGYCVDGEDGQICTQTCTSECPDGWACKSIVSGGGDPEFICVPLFVGICQPCASHTECGSQAADNTDLCIDLGAAGSFCGADCGADGVCPDGFSCEDVALPGGLVATQCIPEVGDCECNGKSIQANLSTPCFVDNEHGVCYGERLCAVDGLTECDAQAPVSESCNLVDDDCDGQTDELIVSEFCENSNEFGTCTGASYCSEGEVFCDAPVPGVEACDGKDNDCNGIVDDGFGDSDGDGLSNCLEIDDDDDGILDAADNCPEDANPDQGDNDLDGIGDECDLDDDNDFVADEDDCEPFDPDVNAQAAEVCDGKDNNCNGEVDEGFLDFDQDGIKDCADDDDDNDGVTDGLDNCPFAPNEDQLNTDEAPDGGDACDPDDDDDLVSDEADNCPVDKNNDQADLDGDDIGDVCDDDRDGDGIPNATDNCPDTFNVGQKNTDGIDDGGDACDDDDDQDFVLDEDDNCPVQYNPDQLDSDGDGVGDACTFDADGDGVLDVDDNCPDDANEDQADLDSDGEGDACDPDIDNDLVLNADDNCPSSSNPNQNDLDGDDIGDVCDDDADGDGDPNLSDCGPINPDVYTGAPEFCNGLDDNCGGGIDEPGAVDCTVYFFDADSDDYGRDDDTLCACAPQPPYDALVGGDCDDAFEDVSPAAPELCDGALDEDCDGETDEEDAGNCQIYYRDFDDDGFGIADNAKCLCGAQGDYTAGDDEDCDDTAKWVYPEAQELCNAIDDDCDGETDEDAAGGCSNFYRDDDGDGFGITEDFVCTCEVVAPYTAPFPGDCADDNPDVHPDADEICNGLDDNCNESIDEAGNVGCTLYFYDADQDGFGTVFNQQCLCQPEGLYNTTEKGDCEDENPLVGPNREELCNDIDDDCDGKVDEEGADGCTFFFLDGDGDGAGLDGTEVCLCEPDFLHQTAIGGDCQDANALVAPGLVERCDDLDNDCDQAFDEGCDDDLDGFCDINMVVDGVPAICLHGGGDCNDFDGTVAPGIPELCDDKDNNCGNGIDEGCDDDGDGYCDAGLAFVASALCPNGAGDCNDQNLLVHPDGEELCSTLDDDDCSGTANDVDATGCVLFHRDQDGDDSGTAVTQCQCYPEGDFTGLDGLDCQDNDPAVNPNALESCLTVGIDDNCDGLLSTDNAIGCTEYFFDNDEDNWGVGSPRCLCFPEGNYTALKGNDCNDTDPSVNPGQVEVCGDGIDNNCTGSEGDPDGLGCQDYFLDGDLDGWGQDDDTLCLCIPSGNYSVLVGGDCNDNDASVNPDATEVCGTPFDDNCDGDLNAAGGAGCITYFSDQDGDGFGAFANECLCVPTGDYTSLFTGDCNDTDATVFPGALESCDGIDNDCTGGVDEICDVDKDGYCDATLPYVGTPLVCIGGPGDCNDLNPTINPGMAEACNDVDDNCISGVDEGCDDDQDGFCDQTMPVVGIPTVCLNGGGDCDDVDASINPNAAELCGNGKDDDCSGLVDDAAGVGSATFFRDSDGDGWGNSFDSVVLCAPSGLYTAPQGGDCNDADPTIHPGAVENCDGVDQDCDGTIDDGAADSECGSTPNGTMVCIFGNCLIGVCDPGYADHDELVPNGCECEDLGGSGSQCGTAATSLSPEEFQDINNTSAFVFGNIAPLNDEDWYKFNATDATAAACDNYHVRITLDGPPGQVFDVYRGGCSLAERDCSSAREYDFDVDDECPCTAEGSDTSDTTKLCSDNSSWYYVRVYQLSATDGTCQPYTLTVSNGD